MLNVIASVCQEILKQDKRWGTGRSLPVDTWLRLIGEEYGEVCKAITDKEPVANVENELLQTAALCLQAVCDLRHRPALPPAHSVGEKPSTLPGSLGSIDIQL